MQLDFFKANEAAPILCADQLSLHFPGRTLFSHLSFRVPAGVSLVSGDESSGKSSLMRVLAGALALQSGRLQIDGAYLESMPEIYRSRVFWIDCQDGIDEQMAVPDFFAALQQQFPQFDSRRLTEMIEGLQLDSHVDKQFYMLSAGSRRKVILAAAFAANARVSLLDDPFAGLDKRSVGFVLQQLRDIARDKRRAIVLADYLPPFDVELALRLDLDQLTPV